MLAGEPNPLSNDFQLGQIHLLGIGEMFVPLPGGDLLENAPLAEHSLAHPVQMSSRAGELCIRVAQLIHAIS